MTEPEGYLTQNERELLARRSEFELAETIQALSALSLLLSAHMEETVVSVRAADPELIRKIGRHTSKTLALLDMLAVVEIAEPVEPAVVVSIVDPEPVVRTVEDAAESTSGLHTAWLADAMGADWASMLGVTVSASADEIASAIVQVYPQRVKSRIELFRARIIHKLEGRSMQEIPHYITDDNSSAANAYLHLLIKRMKSEEPQPVATEPVQPVFVDTIPEIKPVEQLEVVAPVEIHEDDTPRIIVPIVTPVHPESAPEKEVETHVTIAEKIAAQLSLTGSEKMALRSFLDPKVKTDMTDVKLAVIKKVRDQIRGLLEYADSKLNDEELAAVRRAFGAYSAQGIPRDREPFSVYELVSDTRMLNRKSEIPTYIYAGLSKLFPKTTGEQSDAFVDAAFHLDSMTDETFAEQRQELFAKLAADGVLTRDQVAALWNRASFGNNDEHRDISPQLKETLSKLSTLIVEAGGVKSGNMLIDETFKKFVSPNIMVSHLESLQSQLPAEFRNDTRAIERIVVAGVYAVYKNRSEEVA